VLNGLEAIYIIIGRKLCLPIQLLFGERIIRFGAKIPADEPYYFPKSKRPPKCHVWAGISFKGVARCLFRVY